MKPSIDSECTNWNRGTFVKAFTTTCLCVLLTACVPEDPEVTDEPIPQIAAIDGVFAGFSGDDTPGCAVAVGLDGTEALSRAYGMANLEWDIPNTPETVFEPGSVSKQFTAAATILLALDGLIDLDDDIRQYFPELPDYGEAITVRQLINHTSGLRDWGSIAGIGGWPRWSRVHSHKHALDIAKRQESLNYPPGQHYSYTNTGYNLQAMLVERVTGQTFQDFSEERIFGPLGMESTQWRDDFTEIVERRSVAYSQNNEEWHQLMPFENVHGNGGLLTTVGDLLKFTHNLDTGGVGGPEFIRLMHEQGELDSGHEIAYAGGLIISEHRGTRQVAHSGGTAGYRGYLTRLPEQGIAVSVMCNAGQANPGRLALEVADVYLGDAALDDEEADPIFSGALEVDEVAVGARAGGYRDTRRGTYIELMADGRSLRPGQFGPELAPTSESTFASADLEMTLAFEGPGRSAAIVRTVSDDGLRIEPVEPFTPDPQALSAYAGAYSSHEAEVTYWLEVDGETLMARDRYGDGGPLEPVYEDAFTWGGNTLIFRRDETGSITEMSLSQGRVWDLRFTRTQ